MASEPMIPAAHPDTVADAAATPDREMPWKELGLKADEYESIRELLGRRPTNAELAMYSVMWSEHCSPAPVRRQDHPRDARAPSGRDGGERRRRRHR